MKPTPMTTVLNHVSLFYSSKKVREKYYSCWKL